MFVMLEDYLVVIVVVFKCVIVKKVSGDVRLNYVNFVFEFKYNLILNMRV